LYWLSSGGWNGVVSCPTICDFLQIGAPSAVVPKSVKLPKSSSTPPATPSDWPA